jgi:membrane-associated phospholipid phosphatase
MPTPITRPQSLLSQFANPKPGICLAPLAEKIKNADIEAVRTIRKTAQSAIGRALAVNISKLGNGWLYLILVAVVFFGRGSAGFRIVLLAGVNAAALHCLYPVIKRHFRRRRPFKLDPRLLPLLETLDEHSFPSGHAMTLSGVLVPVVLLWPSTLTSAIVMVCGMAWSRVATAHHYPSDILAGAVLGLGVGYPISAGLLALW